MEEIHIMPAEETNSQAVKNYAGAAFMFGMALLAVGSGIGAVVGAIKGTVKSSRLKDSDEEKTPGFTDILDEMKRRRKETEGFDGPGVIIEGEAVRVEEPVAQATHKEKVSDIKGPGKRNN